MTDLLKIKPKITDFPVDQAKGWVLIFPGGGYQHVSEQKEGYAIAKAFNQNGISASVLEYRVWPFPRKKILSDAVKAVRWVKEQAKGEDQRMALMGFSAGAHLALMETLYWQEAVEETKNVSRETFLADALILCYPVVTFRDPYAHNGSRQNFLGIKDLRNDMMIDRYSAENHISPDFPPVYFWHCEEDRSVPIENSLMLRDALVRAGTEYKFRSFPGGGHGLGLAADDEVISQWFPECVNWLKERGF